MLFPNWHDGDFRERARHGAFLATRAWKRALSCSRTFCTPLLSDMLYSNRRLIVDDWSVRSLSDSMTTLLARQLQHQGLPIGFNGKVFTKWTKAQLCTLIELFDEDGEPDETGLELDLCRWLLELKSTPLSPVEQDAVRAIEHSRSIAAARRILEFTPAIDVIDLTRAASVDLITGSAPRPDFHFLAPAETQECQSCLEEVPPESFLAIPDDATCEHEITTMCSECYTDYIESQATSHALHEIPCPEEGCDAILNHTQMQQAAPPEIFDRYDTYVRNLVLRGFDDYVACINPVCEFGGIVDPNEADWMTCEGCGTKTCLSCNTEWHSGLSHEENQANIRRAQEAHARQVRQQEEQSAAMLDANTRRCPNEECKVRIKKDGGCNHMTCKWRPSGVTMLTRRRQPMSP